MASSVSGTVSTAFTLQTEPDTGTFKRRFEDVTTFCLDVENGKILGKSISQWSKFLEFSSSWILKHVRRNSLSFILIPESYIA